MQPDILPINMKKNKFRPANVCLLLATLPLLGFVLPAAGETRLSDYIRPFVGAQGEGNTYPGPSAPFGMIQISPDTDTTNWDTDSGYEYTDPTIMGFSLTHLSGTGCPDLGDFLFVPQVGQPAFVSGSKDHPDDGYQSTFSHADESAAAAYYKVRLQKSGVTTELTAGERAGVLRFTFPASDEASILTDLNHVINGGRWRVGYHAAPVIVDGFLKGVKGFDAQHAYEAIKATAMNPDYDGLASYRKLGYVPCDEEDESLSKTLEYAYDDYTIAQMAKALGKSADCDYFMKRAASYKNIFDPAIGWMHSKDSNGNWRTNFDAHLFGGGTNLQDVTEGTSSQYSWFVQQDVRGLISLMGVKG